ncbi:uncharacterized protein LOC112563170 [Pomacea canaliculata]|uniref:uncharacterized protein LOC112563170 n=1 Tax=Pomacea canaliculata TaxID=400727 RepID=UPI000D72F90B|nr:uncharacterized protein LOC112563170 [Pomacea canaliculata]
MAPDSFWTFLGLVLLVASHVTGQDPCGAAVDSCVGIFDEDLKRAGANDSLVCSASDRLLGCVGSYLGSPSSACDVIRAVQIVQGITNLAASQVKPNCTLGNARLPVLRTDNCSQTINFCAGFLYAAQTQETAADACTFIGYLQQCSQLEPGFANCTQDKLDAMQDYVSSATFRFNDYPTFCADRDRFDVDSANFKFSQCLELTKNLTNGLPRDEMCRLYTSLVACQNDAKAPPAPRSNSHLTGRWRGSSWTCRADPSTARPTTPARRRSDNATLLSSRRIFKSLAISCLFMTTACLSCRPNL